MAWRRGLIATERFLKNGESTIQALIRRHPVASPCAEELILRCQCCHLVYSMGDPGEQILYNFANPHDIQRWESWYDGKLGGKSTAVFEASPLSEVCQFAPLTPPSVLFVPLTNIVCLRLTLRYSGCTRLTRFRSFVAGCCRVLWNLFHGTKRKRKGEEEWICWGFDTGMHLSICLSCIC
jgi:hypothetical protein